MHHEQDPARRVRAVSPDELTELQREIIPPEVIETFNRFIGESAVNGFARVYQHEVVAALEEKGLNSGEIYKRGWLNVEEIYREAGWKVEYDKPGYNENYSPFFIFRAVKKALETRGLSDR